MSAAAKQRWLLPHCLSAALGISCSSNINPTDNNSANNDTLAAQPTSYSDLLVAYAEALSVDVTGLEQQLVSAAGQPDGVTKASRQLQLLDAALLLLAEPVLDMIQALRQQQATTDCSNSSTAADISGVSKMVQTRAGYLEAQLQQLQQQVSCNLHSSKAYLGCLLPGHVLSQCALLVCGSCCWVQVCLEAWAKSLKQARSSKKSKKKSQAAAALHQQQYTSETAAALGRVQQSLCNCLKAASDSSAQLLVEPAAAAQATLVAEFDLSSNRSMQALVGWEARLSVEVVLMDVVKGQRQVLQHACSVAAVLLKRSEAVSW
eukprot:GHRR01019839.1.p1 GENE.GHRR01019839.1~~GHRR01019839.1.p1  ORF type:complete len:319 (+),score=144.95 GHRR01019839.1:1547-2503(+)